MSTTEQHSRRAKVLLATGALVGIVLAASGILEPASPELATTTIARVGQERIDKQEYLNYLELLARDKRNPLTDEDQRHVLNRMIDEKLLLARGLEMGLAQSSPKVRKTIIQQVIQSVLADVSAQEVDDTELLQFYQANIAYFATPPRTQLRRLVFSAQGQSSAQQLAEQAWQALQQGQSFDSVGDRYASEDLSPLPSSPLPDHKLLQYLGPSLTARARQLQAGSYSRPIVVGQNTVILQVIYKQAMEPKSLDEVRDRATVEYQRRRGEQAMSAYLQQLRQQTDVVIDEAFLDTIGPGVDANAN